MVAIVELLFISTNTKLVYFFGEEAPLPWTCHRHRPFFRSQSWVKSTATTTSCNNVGTAFSTIVTCGCKTQKIPQNLYFLTYFRGVGVTSKETVIPSIEAPEPQALLTFACAPPRLVARAGICELRLQNPHLPRRNPTEPTSSLTSEDSESPRKSDHSIDSSSRISSSSDIHLCTTQIRSFCC